MENSNYSNDVTKLSIEALSEKEKTILKLMCEEKSTKEIAGEMNLSPRTVEAIRDRLKTKTGTKSMAGLVLYAVRSGLVSAQESTEKVVYQNFPKNPDGSFSKESDNLARMLHEEGQPLVRPFG